MNSTAHTFKANAAVALDDKQLQAALGNLKGGLVANRARAKAALPEFEDLREVAKEIKNHTIANLDLYLEAYEKKAREAGAIVHFAETAADAREIILKICRDADAKIVTKGKSMVSEEIGLNAHLEAAGGIEVVETDLGEYLVQIRHETPSHIIAPAIHLTQGQVEQDFRRLHTHLPKDRVLAEPEQLVDEARKILRQKFLTADVGITGANFLVAETGSSIIVTNEGNGDLTQSLAKTHVVITSIEKLVPTLEDVSTILRLLARSATGQECSTYTTFSTGGRRPGDPDGPINYHVVILDNGRTDLHRHGVPRGAALYSVWRMHEPLPCLRRHRWPCVWLGLSGAHRRGADTGADRCEGGGQSAQCVDVLRQVRGRVSDEDPAAETDAALARGGVRGGRCPGWLQERPQAVGLLRQAAEVVSSRGQARHSGAIVVRTARAVRNDAVRQWLDQASRPASPARAHVPTAVG